MLFNSFEFLLLFLPVVLLGFHMLARTGRLELVLLWLIICSLFFHGFWKASYTWLFVASICVNFLLGRACLPAAIETGDRASDGRRARKWALATGIAINLGLLAYFKYAMFFSDILLRLSGVFLNVGEVILPLAISFYTFQQIAFLVDCYRGKCRRYSFLQYASYLAFFPHLIAGPIVRHDTLVRQLSNRSILKPSAENLLSGAAIVMVGLFKKLVLADGAATYVDPVFAAAGAHGGMPGFAEAWMAAILFSFVIYFDFSAYSDIAIGLARMFNVRFPANFASPYKAQSLIEFWKRWHITLSRFLRAYLYIPLGGNRKGAARQYGNVMVTMLLAGLWHGAGLNFIVWGGIHGIFLVINHVWRRYCPPHIRRATGLDSPVAGRVLTFLAVTLAWIFFRSSTFDQALAMLRAMAGLNGLGSHVSLPGGLLGNSTLSGAMLCLVLLIIVNALPNTQEFMRRFRPIVGGAPVALHGMVRALTWRLDLSGLALVVALGVAAMMHLERVQPFIYFRF